MAVLIAVVMAVFSFLAKKAGYTFVSRVLGIGAFLAFVGWLASGPGFALIEWIQNPSVDVPSVDINR